jgi:hypothetical protein
MADFKNYDPGRVFVSFNGIRLTGFAAGTFVSAEREEDGFTKVVGSGGDTTRVRNRNRSGMVTVTLLAASPTNDLLSAVAAQDELFGLGTGPLLVKDGNGTTLLEAESAWIRKIPTTAYSKEGEDSREWIFDCAELVMAVGGSLL